MPKFEVFDRSLAPVRDEPVVTVNKRRNFILNRAAYEALGKPSAVELLFDRAERIIGFRATETDADHAYPVRKQANAAIYEITGKAFCTRYQIGLFPTAQQFPAQVVDGILCAPVKSEENKAE